MKGEGVLLLLLLIPLLLAACAPRVEGIGPATREVSVADGAFVMADGYRLPYRQWGDPATATAVLVGLHGFNDYSAFLSNAGPVWSERNILTVAYDQRGFGETENRGLWHGRDALIRDAQAVMRLMRERHPAQPIFLMGESMGGAVAIAAMGEAPEIGPAGTILAAPAAADWDQFAWYQRWALWAAAHTLPWLEMTGEGLKVRPSDNREILRALFQDPLVIKRTRIDAVWGLLRLGDRAFDAAGNLPAPALVLWGAKEELIPPKAQAALDRVLPAHATRRRYPNGYHMLTRDLSADVVLRDIADWVLAKTQAAPLD